MKTKDIISHTGTSQKAYSVQRDRLIKKGITDGREHGTLKLILPRFEEYVKAVGYL